MCYIAWQKGINVAERIKVKDFEMGQVSWVIEVDLIYHVNPQKWITFLGHCQREMEQQKEGQKNALLVALKMEKGSHEPRNVGTF